MPDYPPLAEVEQHTRAIRKALRDAGVPTKTIQSIQTKALRTPRKVTGEHKTNREVRWKLAVTHPHYGTEHDCKIIFVKLCAQIFCFDNAPMVDADLKALLEERYLGEPIVAAPTATACCLNDSISTILFMKGLIRSTVIQASTSDTKIQPFSQSTRATTQGGARCGAI
jgi:hypothetical protein